MKQTQWHFLRGLALTALLAAAAILAARLPFLKHLGALSLALLLGLAWRGFNSARVAEQEGIAFAAKKLLRLGIIFLGVRLNLDLLVQAGPKILLLDLTVIVSGLFGISWLGRRFGLDPVLACLIAVDSSICGGSAVAAAAPTLRAKDDDIALVIPMCSLIGTGAMLVFTFIQHRWELTPAHYGMITGATLHEVAQVMAAVAPFPEAAGIGTVTKLTRVVLLVPAVLVLGRVFARKRNRAALEAGGVSASAAVVPKPWFVLGFLLVGVVNTIAARTLPIPLSQLTALDQHMLDVANLLIAMSMAGMGLQIDFNRLRAHGLRAFGTAVLGWAVLAGLTITEIWVLTA